MGEIVSWCFKVVWVFFFLFQLNVLCSQGKDEPQTHTHRERKKENDPAHKYSSHPLRKRELLVHDTLVTLSRHAVTFIGASRVQKALNKDGKAADSKSWGGGAVQISLQNGLFSCYTPRSLFIDIFRSIQWSINPNKSIKDAMVGRFTGSQSGGLYFRFFFYYYYYCFLILLCFSIFLFLWLFKGSSCVSSFFFVFTLAFKARVVLRFIKSSSTPLRLLLWPNWIPVHPFRLSTLKQPSSARRVLSRLTSHTHSSPLKRRWVWIVQSVKNQFWYLVLLTL